MNSDRDRFRPASGNPPADGDKRETVVLVDAFSLLYRAYYALPELRTREGVPTHAVYGFALMLFPLLDEERPDFLAVVTDRPGRTFRDELFAEYKAQRPDMPDDLALQIPMLYELIDALNIPVVGAEGYEADDCIGTLARVAVDTGRRALIVTGDRDCLQLVGERVEVVLTRRGIRDVERLDVEGVKEKLGVLPWQIPDLKGLTGDASDNIPGVPGVGPKTAVKWLSEYGSLEALLENAHAITGKVGENLRRYADQARLSKQLATIDTGVPLAVDWSALRRRDPDWERLTALLRKWEFHSLLNRFSDQSPRETTAEQVSLRIESSPDVNAHGTVIVTDGNVEEVRRRLQGADTIGVAVIARNEHPLDIRAALVAVGWQGGGCVFSLDTPQKGPLALLRQLLGDARRTKILFDAKVLSHGLHFFGIPLEPPFHDVMIASYLLNADQGAPRPDAVVKAALGEDLVLPLEPCRSGDRIPGALLWKEDFASLDRREMAGRLLALAGAFVRTWPVLEEKLRTYGMEGLYREIELPLTMVLAKMERAGVRVDSPYLRAMGAEMESRLRRMSDEIYRLAGEPFNINSPRQLARILYEKLGLPVLKRTKTGPSTDAAVLEELAVQHDLPAALIAYRQVSKLKSTYVDALPALVHPRSGRIHTSFHQVVAATGRLSSTHPNLQNIPVRTDEGRLIRGAFVVDESHVLLAADYSQIELRILAHLSGDERFLEAFRRGEDIHIRTAAEVFGVKPGEVTRQQRAAAKAINFGIIYGISSFGLARGTGLTVDEARRYIDGYFERYPGVKAYLDRTVAEARERGYVTTLFGRRRPLPEIHSRQRPRRQFAERAAMNAPIQGSAADIIKASMVRLQQRLEEMGTTARLVLQVHDELVLECPRDALEPVARAVKECMENAAQLQVPLDVELRVGPNWKDTEPYTVP